jgi:hypothetical protein
MRTPILTSSDPPTRPASATAQSGGPLVTALLLAVFSIPFVGGIVGRTLDGGWWPDLDAIVCAGTRVEQGLSPYSAAMCPGTHSAAFVYAPIVAEAAAGLIAQFGPTGFRLGYIVVFALALGVCAFEALVWPLPAVTLRARAMFMALVTGTLVTAGNVGVICHAAIIGALLAFPRRRAPFLAAVALATLIKPTFAAYLVVLLLEPVGWRTKFGRLMAGVGAVAAAAGVVFLFERPALQDWAHSLRQAALIAQSGRGFLGWAAQAGLDGASPVGACAFALLAALLILAGLSTVRRAAFGPNETLAFALGLAQLLNPRLMTYDELALVPMGALTCLAAGRISSALGAGVRIALGLACGLALVCGCVGWMLAGQRAAALTLTLATVVVGARSWRRP